MIADVVEGILYEIDEICHDESNNILLFTKYRI